jgi:hypothetical protein
MPGDRPGVYFPRGEDKASSRIAKVLYWAAEKCFLMKWFVHPIFVPVAPQGQPFLQPRATPWERGAEGEVSAQRANHSHREPLARWAYRKITRLPHLPRVLPWAGRTRRPLADKEHSISRNKNRFIIHRPIRHLYLCTLYMRRVRFARFYWPGWFATPLGRVFYVYLFFVAESLPSPRQVPNRLASPGKVWPPDFQIRNPGIRNSRRPRK